MKQKEVKQLAIDLMSKHDLTEQGWTFEFDSARRRFGLCNYGTKTISLSKWYLPHMKQVAIKDTILHEIAHALVGSNHGHDRVWQRKARQIGCNGYRCGSDSDLYAGATDTLAKQSKYSLKCSKCGRTTPMHRKPKRSRSCGKCGGGVYRPELKMELIQNY